MVTVLDSFEDGDISEYSGDTGGFQTTTSKSYDGNYAVEGTDGGYTAIYRTDKTIAVGSVPFGGWVDPGVGYTGTGYPVDLEFGILFAVPDAEKAGYFAGIDADSDEFVVERIDSGPSFTTLGSNTVTVSSGNWYNVEVTTWDSNGNISVSLKDSGGTELSSLSVTDTTYGSGGIGWVSYSSGSGTPDPYPQGDYYTKPTPLSAPTNVHFNDTATEDELTIDWDPVDGAAGYYVYRAQASGSTTSDYTQVADVTSPPYTDTGLEDGEKYYYRVSSHD